MVHIAPRMEPLLNMWLYQEDKPTGEKLMDEIMQDNIPAISALLELEPTVIGYSNVMGQTPVMVSACWGRDEALALLIEAKGDVNFQNRNGMSALHGICENALDDDYPFIPAMVQS